MFKVTNLNMPFYALLRKWLNLSSKNIQYAIYPHHCSFIKILYFKIPNILTEFTCYLKKILWAQQQVSKLRVKRDMLDATEEDKFSKRAENLAYRSVSYDDPKWADQWYLVSDLRFNSIYQSCLFETENFEKIVIFIAK